MVFIVPFGIYTREIAQNALPVRLFLEDNLVQVPALNLNVNNYF